MPVASHLLHSIAALLLLAPVVRTQEPVRTVVLAHANVIDGAGDTPQRDVTVVRSGGKIERITKGDVSVAGALVIDLHGRWVLPGLIDAHTHISSLASAKRALESGVTTVRSASTTRITQEIVNFTELGFTPMEAIRAGTSLAADCLGIGAKTGRLTAGLEADLIVVEGNPLDDIRIIQDVTIVISNGRVALNRLPFGK